ncbi:MAG: hypothetical protein LBV29_07060, partial [Azoarcus sp.]|nr:hypothetical protein [Azoarcus sp.]
QTWQSRFAQLDPVRIQERIESRVLVWMWLRQSRQIRAVRSPRLATHYDYPVVTALAGPEAGLPRLPVETAQVLGQGTVAQRRAHGVLVLAAIREGERIVRVPAQLAQRFTGDGARQIQQDDVESTRIGDEPIDRIETLGIGKRKSRGNGADQGVGGNCVCHG